MQAGARGGIVVGIGFVLAAGLLLAALDAIAKHLTTELPILQIAWARYVFHTLLTLAYLASTSGTRLLRTRRPGVQLTRGIILIVASLMMYTALAHVPLADATAVQFFAPVLVTLLSAIFLSERIGVHRIAAVAAGFAGVLLIVRPGFSGTDPYLLLAFASACLLSVFYLLTRQLAVGEEREATLFNTTAVGAVVLSLLVPLVWETPTAGQFALLVLVGGLGGLGHFCMIQGFAHASASVLSPFLYGQVLFATLLSISLFGDRLALPMLLGTVLLVGSGIYIWWRER